MDSPDTSLGFDRLGLAPAVLDAVRGLGYETPTPIQVQCIPHLLAGRDLVGQAQTGTGKTAAFALPLLSRIEPATQVPQVLVLTPTRELALQVAEAFQRYARGLPGFRVLPLYGGQSYRLQIHQLARGAQVIVGTPGRVMDHLRQGYLNLGGIRTLVLDEADEMLDMGFAEDIEWIFGQAPAERQVVLFSATMPAAIRKVAQSHLADPVEIRIGARMETVDTIAQRHCVVTRYHKLDVLTRLLEVEPFDAMLVFVRTKNETAELAEKLVAHGFSAEALNGDMNQAERERTVSRLKRGTLDILVATDVAARGLDVERIGYVVNYDIPTDPGSYIHRIGRTGRAGRAGRALSLVEPRERHLLRAIEKTIHQQIPPLAPPTAGDLSEHRIDRFTAALREALAGQDLDFFYRLVARIAREEELEAIDIAAALAFLVQRERPLVVRESEPDREPRFKPMPPQGPAPQRPPRIEAATRLEPAPDRPPRSETTSRSEPARDRPPPSRDAARSEPAPGRQSPADSRPRRERADEGLALVSYRIEVGRRDGVSPREIVGAIANEAGLEGRYIGRIDIRDDHSLVDLPEGMPREIYQHLRRVLVCGKPLQLRLLDGQMRPPRGSVAGASARESQAEGPGRAGRDEDRPREARPPRRAVPAGHADKPPRRFPKNK